MMLNRSRVLFALVLVVGSAVVVSAERRNPPNIVLMMADDMGLGDTSAYQDLTGNRDSDQVHTPQMERLARRGVRFNDAHTPASRCTTTRYGLLTGRYAWRNRMKHWGLFGAQGDPLIERDRPTLATLLQDHGYATAMVGKWHVGLRYRRADGKAARGWGDADLQQPLADSPLDHGFDYCRFTSRSHGTSGPDSTRPVKNVKKRNGPQQEVGPGHIHGRVAVAATPNGKRLKDQGATAYVLEQLGSRHSDHAVEFLDGHLAGEASRKQPFFLYYPSNSNHGPYTPDQSIDGQPVAGASRSVSGQPLNARADFIYENDVALGRLLDYLEQHADPRAPGKALIDNTIVIFTSDNGAERDDEIATGPFRSNKGSCYEGGHRVPFLVSWPAGDVGDGDATDPGLTSDALVGLQDMFATFAEVLQVPLPNVSAGQTGAEDSLSVLSAWRGEQLPSRPMLFHDHKQSRMDPAAVALRVDNPRVHGQVISGQWKLFLDATFLRHAKANPLELFDLASDRREQHNRLADPELQPLVQHLLRVALLHGQSVGHRLAKVAANAPRTVFDWRRDDDEQRVDGTQVVGLAKKWADRAADTHRVTTEKLVLDARVNMPKRRFSVTAAGLGLAGGGSPQFDDGEVLELQFDQDVIIESVTLIAGAGACGGFYQMGDRAPAAIYCVDADGDTQDQSGILSDLGVLKRGQRLRLDTHPHWGVETPGNWRVGAVTVRVLAAQGGEDAS